MATWTTDEFNIAREMRDNGASSREIGLRLGRTRAAVRSVLRDRGVAQSRKEWMAQFSHDAIEYCPEQKRLIQNAIEGSAKLRDALLGLVA